MRNKTLPILLKNPKILLIGGGNVALQKAQVLHENNIDFRVITDVCLEEIYELCTNITIKPFELSDIEENIIVYATYLVPSFQMLVVKIKI